MVQNLQVGETVYVPRARLGLDANSPNAFHRTTVREVVNRSVRVDMPDGNWSDAVASSVVHRNVGLLICRIGDFQTELALLDPLAKSLLQYFRLLVPDDMVQLCEVRALQEMSQYWGQVHAAYSHVILIGHGRADGVLFGVGGWADAEKLVALLSEPNPTPKTIVSLCCQTGYADFSKSFSEADVCHALVSPFHSVHGAIASQFCQSFFAHHLLVGETPRIAFRHAREATPGSTRFRIWENGRVTGGEP